MKTACNENGFDGGMTYDQVTAVLKEFGFDQVRVNATGSLLKVWIDLKLLPCQSAERPFTRLFFYVIRDGGEKHIIAWTSETDRVERGDLSAKVHKVTWVKRVTK